MIFEMILLTLASFSNLTFSNDCISTFAFCKSDFRSEISLFNLKICSNDTESTDKLRLRRNGLESMGALYCCNRNDTF